MHERLLTDEELDNIGYIILPLGDRTGSRRLAKAQDAKTASIIDAEWRAKERYRMLRENIIDSLHWVEFTFLGQSNLVFRGILTQSSEEVIADQILSLIKEVVKKCQLTDEEK